MTITRVLTVTMVATVLLMACTGGEGTGEQNDGRGAPEATAVSTSAARLELTGDNLDAYARGMKKEVEAVRAAQERSSAATTAQERGEAIQSSFEHATIPQGAEAAGLPVEQYRELRETVNRVFETLDFQEKIDGPLSMDLSRADDATKGRLARDPFDDLSPDSAAALRARMNRLVPVWIEYVTLTAVAG